MYQRPYTKEEILQKFDAETSGKLLNDKVHSWRAESGIELIHKEPTFREQMRIWRNWKQMSDEMKKKSDEKSIELWGMDNRKHNRNIFFNYLLNALIAFLLAFVIATFVARMFSGNEDTWICSGGEWVRHGSPASEMPRENCAGYAVGEVTVGGNIIKVEIADTENKRVLGLSGREGLATSSGMFFVFENEDRHTFWMKDMRFPIDIVFINNEMEIVGVEKGVATSTYPNTFGKDVISKYVLEIQSGASDVLGLQVGKKIIFSIK